MPHHTTTYTFGDIVYLITDPMQEARMVTGIDLRPGQNTYQLSLGSFSTEHFEIEICSEVNLVASLGLSKEVGK